MVDRLMRRGDVVGQQHKQQRQVGYGNPRRRLTQSGGIGMGNDARSSPSTATSSPEQLDYITIILLYLKGS